MVPLGLLPSWIYWVFRHGNGNRPLWGPLQSKVIDMYAMTNHAFCVQSPQDAASSPFGGAGPDLLLAACFVPVHSLQLLFRSGVPSCSLPLMLA